jgi:hypothetical protein
MELAVSSRRGNHQAEEKQKQQRTQIVSAIWIPDRIEFVLAVEGKGAGVRRVCVEKVSGSEENVEHDLDALSCQVGVSRALQPTPSRLERLINSYASSGDSHQRAEVIVGYGAFSVRILDPRTLDDVALIELKSPPRCVSFLNADGALLVAGVGGDLVLLQAPDTTADSDANSSTVAGKPPSPAPLPQELNTYFSPVSAIVSIGPNIAWIVGGSNCCRLELDPATSIGSIALSQKISVAEPIAAATRAPLAKVGGTSLFCFGDRGILHIQPSLDPSKPTAAILQSLELSEPISAVFPAPTMQAPPIGAPYPASGGYICTASGQLVSVHVTAGDDGKREFRLGEFQELPFTEQMDDSHNRSGGVAESSLPIGVNVTAIPSPSAERTLPMPEDVVVHATIVYQDKVVVFPAGNLIVPLEQQAPPPPPPATTESSAAEQPSAAAASENGTQEFMATIMSTASTEFKSYLDEQLRGAKQESTGAAASGSHPRVAITLSLDTADLEQCAPLMNVPTKVKLVGEGPEEVVFIALPYQASIGKIQQLLEERFDRRIVISFEVVTHTVVQNPLLQPRGARSYTPTGDAATGKVKKLLELRSANIKVFHAMEPEDRMLVCRSLFPQVSRSRVQTPSLPGIRSQTPGSSYNLSASHNGSGALNDASSIQRPGTSLSSTQERSMVERLYADCGRSRALKLLQLEQKFFPTLKEKPISKKEESVLLERVTTGFMKSKQQAREKVVHQFEKEGYIRPPPTKPNLDEEQAIIQKFYYERLKKEKIREEQLNAKLFKGKPSMKLKTEEEWKQWQEHRAKDIKKEFRLRDQFY